MSIKSKTTSFLHGIDVSHYQGTINWSAVKKAGISFSYIKATEGGDLVDATFATNWQGSLKVGVTRGAYHLFRPLTAVQTQVNNFVNTVKALKNGDLPPVLDLEVPQDWTTIAQSARMPLIIEWLTKVEAALGVQPVVYMSPSFVTEVLGGDASALSGYQLWIADYGVSTPSIPSAWTVWFIWQNSDSGTVSGVTGGVDLDFFNGSSLDFRMSTYSSTRTRRLLKILWCKLLQFLGW